MSNGIARQRMARRVTFMCLLVLTTFTLTVTPLAIDLVLLGQGTPGALEALVPLYVLSLANTCVNPLIYGFMWKSFRGAMVQVR